LNRLATVTDHAGQVTAYGYDAVGNRASVTYPNGNVTAYTYDNLNRLTHLVHKDSLGNVLSGYGYQLHATGRREKITETSGRVTDYTYDNLYRLTDEAITDAINGNYTANYQYDVVGNRTYETVDGVQTAYAYDFNDRLLSNGGYTYTYDNQGNTLTQSIDGNVTHYVYNSQQELISVTQPDNSVLEYSYNINGIRTAKTEAGITTTYVIDENTDYAQVLVESNGTDSVVYTFGDDLLSQDRNNAFSFYLYDGLGSTRGLSNSSGAVTDTYNYEAFGELLNSTGSTANDFRFTGEQLDDDLGQYYLRARRYDPNTGRFTQQDAYMGVNGDPVTLHKYLYANVDPVNYNDPTGLYSIGELMTAVSVRGTQAAQTIVTRTGIYKKALWGEVKDFAKDELTSQAFGLIGDMVLGNMIDAVQVASKKYPNVSAQSFGTKAHKELQDLIDDNRKSLEKQLRKMGVNVKIRAEVFRDESGSRAKRQNKGSMGLDVAIIGANGKVLLAFDLKTGKSGTSKRKAGRYMDRFDGAPIIDVFVKRK
jgi:RHS repeat-associated protein